MKQDFTELEKETEDQFQQRIEDLERRVAEQAKKLQEAAKELEAFAYSVSHDLRAPLRAIAGYTQILVEDYGPGLDDEGKRVCGVIDSETRRMGQFIDALLVYSRVGQVDLQMMPVDMQDLVETVFQDRFPAECREKIAFEAGPLDPSVCDLALICQVWQNLLSNAIKFSSGRDHPVIKVKSQKIAGEVIYSITDNGAGFDMQYAGNLFGVFQRLHSESEFEGIGVGLAIVKRIINRHDGRIWAEGIVDQGAAFHFTLPVKEDGS